MKKVIRNSIDFIIKNFGLKTIRIYEIQHIKIKYREAILELLNAYLMHENNTSIQITEKRINNLSTLYGTGVTEGIYILDYLNKSLKLKGDVCEFGIANGATSFLIANEIKNSNKHLWLFDSFKGLSKPSKEDRLLDDIFNLGSIGKYEGTMSYSKLEVERKLNTISFPKSKTHLVEGFINESIMKDNKPKKVCFAYIDFDLYEPTSVALDFLDNVMAKNGYIVVDDYNYFSSGVKKSVDQFIRKNKNKYKFILPLSYAGKFCIIKRLQ